MSTRDLDRLVISSILRTANLLIKAGNQICSDFNITQQQWVLLESLSRAKDGLYLSSLGRNLLVTKSNITGMIDRLERGGFVVREPCQDDRRVLIAKITNKGRQTLQKIHRKEDAWNRQHLSALTSDEKEAVVVGLRQLFDSVYHHLYKKT